MASGQEQINDLEYREKIRGMPDRELLEYVAVEQYYIKLNCLKTCENQTAPNKKQTAYNAAGVSGGVMSLINMAIMAIQQWLGK